MKSIISRKLFGGIACACAFAFLLFAPNSAFADSNVTVNSQDDNGRIWQARQVFSSDFTDDGSALHVKFAEGLDPDTFASWLDGSAVDGSNYSSWLKNSNLKDASNPQNEAEYISHMINDSSSVQGEKFATHLARFIVENKTSAEHSLQEGASPTSLANGWWLLSAPDAQPMFVISKGEDLNLTAKPSMPHVSKLVKEGDEYVETADASAGDNVPYRIDVTLPPNFNLFDSYKLDVIDKKPEKMTIDEDSISVTFIPGIGAEHKISDFDTSVGKEQFVISWKDLKQTLSGFGEFESGTVRIDYTASMPSDGISVGSSHPNTNSVHINYPPSPISDEYADSIDSSANLLAWKLKLVKTDGSTTRLPDAKFTLKNVAGNYWTGDGFGEKKDAKTLVTGEDGTLDVTGIDSGVYTLVEVEAPKGYKKVEGNILLTVSTKVKDDKVSLTAKCDGAKVTEVDASDGTIELNVTDKRIKTNSADDTTGEKYAKTGETMAILIAIAILLAFGSGMLFGYGRRKR